ncbi:MAG: alpha-hydroxy-acid oxidizing protein, partial [Thiotrichales bacterium]|nr:alpha-hydroxy-acid oxidizing protein [Thiotrichales bacterium]
MNHSQTPSLRQFKALAKQHIRHPQAWNYLQDSAGTGRTYEANLHAFIQPRLIPRPLMDVRSGHTRLELLGQSFEHPVLLAPIAYQMLFHAHGEQASAAAASAQGSTLVVSSLA